MTQQAIARQQGGKAAIVSDKNTLETLVHSDAFQEALKAVLPKHITPERVLKMAFVAASRQPKLFQCTRESFIQSVMKSAELGLDCSGTLGRAYLVPYYNNKISAYECQFIPGYQGLIELARRSGNIARIESRVVYANDQFSVEYGLDQKLIHRPTMNGDRGAMICVYAIAELTDGSRQIEVMTLEEVNGIRSRSKAKDSGPWVTDYPEMARKTVIRRIAKYLPLSTELAKALEADDDQFIDNGFHDAMASEARVGVAAVKDRLHVIKSGEEPVEDTQLPRSAEDDPGAANLTPVDPSEIETVNEPEAEDADELDELESLRADVQAVFDGLSKSQQKDLIAGKTPISKANQEELIALLGAMESL